MFKGLKKVHGFKKNQEFEKKMLLGLKKVPEFEKTS